jgi:signal transduction histidine kinase
VSDLAERRRFERALHDGVQQDLIALAVRLQLAQELLATDAGEAALVLEELRNDVHTALDSLRALSAEIYPPLLDARGLRDALNGIPRVRLHDVGRHAPDIEAAVYFCCLESPAEIDVYEADGRLRIEVRGTITSRFRELAEAAGVTFHESAR